MSDGFLLTAEEREELTGYKRPSKQVEVLRALGIRHYVGPDGHPRVLRAQFEQPEEPQRPKPQPRLEGLAKHG